MNEHTGLNGWLGPRLVSQGCCGADHSLARSSPGPAHTTRLVAPTNSVRLKVRNFAANCSKQEEPKKTAFASSNPTNWSQHSL